MFRESHVPTTLEQYCESINFVRLCKYRLAGPIVIRREYWTNTATLNSSVCRLFTSRFRNKAASGLTSRIGPFGVMWAFERWRRGENHRGRTCGTLGNVHRGQSLVTKVLQGWGTSSSGETVSATMVKPSEVVKSSLRLRLVLFMRYLTDTEFPLLLSQPFPTGSRYSTETFVQAQWRSKVARWVLWFLFGRIGLEEFFLLCNE